VQEPIFEPFELAAISKVLKVVFLVTFGIFLLAHNALRALVFLCAATLCVRCSAAPSSSKCGLHHRNAYIWACIHERIYWNVTMDVFDQKIVCKHCNKQMKPAVIQKKGMQVRSVTCEKCGVEVIHPSDQAALEQYGDLKGKTFTVKLRTVGNSHAVSIPKEIVRFINDTHKQMERDMDNMVKLCFEDFGRLSMRFGEFDKMEDNR
jgi:transcription elongation factor Elf1